MYAFGTTTVRFPSFSTLIDDPVTGVPSSFFIITNPLLPNSMWAGLRCGRERERGGFCRGCFFVPRCG
jgi:hypothetical protein